MPQMIEEAVKALTEFETELDRIKAEALEAKKRLVKGATDEAEVARKGAISRAQMTAEKRLNAAKTEAEREAESIAEKGSLSLNQFKTTISRRKEEAVNLVMRRLLGA